MSRYQNSQGFVCMPDLRTVLLNFLEDNIPFMLYYIKKYPFSLLIILAVIYLSFFKPPSTRLSLIPNIDKVVHVCMYLGMSGMLWLEFIRAHKKDGVPMWHAWIGAFLCPVLFSGAVELLQEYCTTYRGGDWLDFAANSTGAVLASLVGWWLFVRVRRK